MCAGLCARAQGCTDGCSSSTTLAPSPHQAALSTPLTLLTPLTNTRHTPLPLLYAMLPQAWQSTCLKVPHPTPPHPTASCPAGRDVASGSHRIQAVQNTFRRAAQRLEDLAAAYPRRSSRDGGGGINYLEALFDVSSAVSRSGRVCKPTSFQGSRNNYHPLQPGDAADAGGHVIYLGPASTAQHAPVSAGLSAVRIKRRCQDMLLRGWGHGVLPCLLQTD